MMKEDKLYEDTTNFFDYGWGERELLKQGYDTDLDKQREH